MKRILSILLIVVLMLSFAVSVSAIGNVLTCKASKDTVKAGDTVTITIINSGNDAFASVGLTFEYNRAIFEPDSGKWVASGFVLSDFNKDDNRAVAALSNAAQKSGDLFELVLKVKADAPAGTYAVRTVPKMKNGTLEVTVASTEINIKVEAGAPTASNTQSSGGNTSEPLNHVHNYGDFVVDSPATCHEPGVKSRHCSECGGRGEITTIEALGHNWSDWVIDSAPTIDAVGKKHRTCKNEGCGEKQNAEIAKLTADGHEHLFSDWFFTKEPTCTEKGEATRVCSKCDAQEKSEAASLGHKFGGWRVKVQPTVEKEGVIESVCEVCSHAKTLPLEKLIETDSGVFSMPIIILLCVVLVAGVIVVLIILTKKKR